MPSAQRTLSTFAAALTCLSACEGSPTVGQSGTEAPSDSFGEMLPGNDRYLPPATMNEAVQQAETVVVGEVVNLVEGRREDLGDGSNPEFYVQHYDIVIQPDHILKGESSTAADVHVEFIWPRNRPTDDLSAALPRGAGAIVLGMRPDGAAATPHTLLTVAPYGLVFEGPDGQAVLPFERDKPLHEVVPGSQETFEDLRSSLVGDN